MQSARIIRPALGFLSLACISFWPASGHAQYSGYYVELSGGPSEAEVKFLPATSEVSSASAFEAESDTFTFTTGLRFNDNIAVEVGYTDYGKYSGPASLRDTVYFARQDPVTEEVFFDEAAAFVEGQGEYEATAFTASLIGSLPLSRRWAAYGELGLSAWDVESEFVGTVTFNPAYEPPSRIRADFSDGGSSFFYSAGFLYRFNLSYGIKVEYQNARIESDIFSGDADVESMTLGLRLYF